MSTSFTKMHGLGNDFVVIEALKNDFSITPEQIRHLADRNFGIGFDQLLVVEPPTSAEMDFSYRIFNADGNEVEQCGNGARCFARFVYDRGLTDKTKIRVGTLSGIIVPQLMENGLVCVNMGQPEFEPAKIPFITETRQKSYSLLLEQQTLEISAVSMGNPHAVVLVDDVEMANVHEIGRQIEIHSQFPRQVNAGFMQILDRHNIRLRVWERGSGETLACGTGACAAVSVGIDRGLLDSPVTVQLSGGDLVIEWPGENAAILMTGPADYVYEGMIEMEKI